MGFDTVNAITENLRTALRRLGLQFPAKAYDGEKNIPASMLPLATVQYRGESFERTLGQRPGYAEAEFLVKVFLTGGDSPGAASKEQEWVHSVRDAVTVDALNTGGLAVSKDVTRVAFKDVAVKGGASLSSIACNVSVRYREK